ncbi:MAG: ATP-binding protein [Clostridiales bacterium]|nr:ATP-binding protein [Clostridiales bacterium]
MAYDGKIMRRALARYEEDKQRRQESYQVRRRTVYSRIPRIEAIDKELKTTMSRLISSALQRGTDPVPAIRVLRDRNLDLQRERAELLTRHDYPADYLEEKPNCALCGDTGYRQGSVCRCLQEYYTREQIKELSNLLDMGTQSFDTFDFKWYSDRVSPEQEISPRANMERNFDLCQDYANEFGPRSSNLLLCGDPGLGKTFLSACIARVVSEGGYSVVYDTASHIFSQFESAKFHRDGDYGSDPEADVNRCLQCDLLIVDDLGTEMITSFVQSALYQIVNTRLLTGKKTIISTNLNPDQIGSRYSGQILSRIEGEYEILPFFGTDIRRLKREGI